MATHTPGHLRPGGGQERRPAPQTRTAGESPACYREGDSDKAEGSVEAPNQLLKERPEELRSCLLFKLWSRTR